MNKADWMGNQRVQINDEKATSQQITQPQRMNATA